MKDFDKICNDAGFVDLKASSRKGDIPLKRQAVWCKMYMDGARYTDIGRQSGRTHATVLLGVRKFKDLVSIGDAKAIDLWKKIEKM